MPLAELQSEWVADLLEGVGALPSYAEMRAEIAGYEGRVRKRYVASKRHTLQVDFHANVAELERERRLSRARLTGSRPRLLDRVAARRH
jgi:hypothetical protein